MLAACCSWVLVLAPASRAAVPVTASVETDPVPSGGDAADDPEVWVHPTVPGASVVLGTDKQSGLGVYGLDGTELQFLASGRINNVDVRYGFPLGGAIVDIAAGSERDNDAIVVWSIDATTGLLSNVTVGGGIATGLGVYGFCLYRSPTTARYHAFVNSRGGDVEQWELSDDGSGEVTGTLVRSFDVGTQTEGCVADDEYAALYIGEENAGIWRYGAEPGDGTARTSVDVVGGGALTADVEGLSLYSRSDGTGYLLASSQGNDEFAVYERTGANAYVGNFTIVAGASTDGASDTDGIAVVSTALGASFPNGLFVAQDGSNSGVNQNFKLVDWDAIAVPLALVSDPSFEPRSLLPACSNGADDDGDGFADFGSDPGCVASTSGIEAPQCQDGANNDNQFGTDFDGGLSAGGPLDPDGPDPHCASFADNRESQTKPVTCGMGPELAVLVPMLAAARRRVGAAAI